MSRKFVYFSTRYPKPISNSIKKNIRFTDSTSAVVFSDAIFKGLVECGLVFENVNFSPIGYWPQMNRRIYNSTVHCFEQYKNVWDVGTVNIPIFQNISLYWHTLSTIKKILNEDPAVCLVYAIHPPIIRAILQYKRKYSPRTKIVLIIPDFVEDMYNGHSIKSNIQRRMYGDIDEIYRQMDGFVYLTEQMRERTKSEEPFCVVEGVYDSSDEKYIHPDFNKKEKTIFYSGKLEKKFGAQMLVDAFSMIPDEDVRLLLCGSGDSEEYIKQRAISDKRIKYCGQISRDEVLRLQADARLLVNPRSPEGEFTKYSFPSKNIQYLASGIPTLLYQLDGIPQEYYNYCISIEKNKLTTEDLSQYLQKGIQMSADECKRMGDSARQFVLDKKNAKIQSQKIIDLFNEI